MLTHTTIRQESRKSLHDTPTIQSLDRGLAILEAVAGSPVPVPLKQLTELMGIDRSSVFRLANTLRQRRFLANPKGSNDYILGPTAWRLSRRYGRTVLGTFFHHYLQDLSATLGETSHFAVREGVEVFFIDHHIPRQWCGGGATGVSRPCTAPRMEGIARRLRSAAARAMGLAARAHPRARGSVKRALCLRAIRVDGSARRGGIPRGVTCVAAPIRDPRGRSSRVGPPFVAAQAVHTRASRAPRGLKS